MSFKDLLIKYKVDKARVIINGLGTGEVKGSITEVHDDYIKFELLDARKEVKSGKEKTIKEIKYIPIANIFDLSEGETENTAEPGLAAFGGGEKK